MNCWPTRLVLVCLFICCGQAATQEPLTVAEKSGFQATSRHADVVTFCQHLARMSPVVRLGELGKSVEGRTLPLVILADPPVSTPEQAAKSGKPVVFAFANIHAGEVDGKEALLMLARELATSKERPLLKDLVIVLAPLFNADGNEKIATTNRRHQDGPKEGVGVRENAQGLDLNRDFVKLETPEVRALVRFLRLWDPALVVDMHTTNGSIHRYTLTYEGPRNPASDPKLIALVNEELLPNVTRRLEKRTGYRSFFYGNFSRDRMRWETVPATARYSTHYLGLRHCLGILSEAYVYASYKDRIVAGREFVRSCFEYVAEHKQQVIKLRRAAQGQGAARTEIAIRHHSIPVTTTAKILGFVDHKKGGQPQDYEVQYVGKAEPTVLVKRPHAYLFPAGYAKAIEVLQRHGLQVDELREDIELDVEVYRATKVIRQERTFQKHNAVSVEATSRPESRRIPAGTIIVRTGQPLGNLAVYLLEPESEDGLVTWNFFDEGLKDGQDYPVLRLPGQPTLMTGRVRPLAEDRTFNKLISAEGFVSFSGSPVSGLTWLEDGEHYLQVKDGRQFKVHALTGRAEPYHDPDKLAAGLKGLVGTKGGGQRLGSGLHMNPPRTGALLDRDNDLFYCNLDGTGAVRLTKTAAREELATFSPDGKLVAFVRDNNLHVVDIATQTERALTKDGTEVISNGKADWVYFEEIFNRSWHAFWWSPDSTHIAFLRFDDTPVHKSTVVNHIPVRQVVEHTPYPKAGDPNPTVRLGLVAVAGGATRWVELPDYPPEATLIIRAGWLPGSRHAYFYIQDRAQTWLDVCTVPATGGPATRLFRETTKAWVEDLGPPTFLKDGSFLVLSERSGWKHLYRYDKSGMLRGPVTSGEWELTSGLFVPNPVLHVDESAGWVYFTAKKDSPIASNLYRVRIDGTGLERLTTAPGDHRITMSPKGNFFIDSWSSHTTPTRVRLHRADGTPVRLVDTNPVYHVEEYRLGKYELLQIPLPDGFLLEGSLLRPPDFDPQKRYPVWFKTYGGPHAPTVSDSWGTGQAQDQSLAALGFVVFRCDPRSASGKGVASTWTAYRQLGVQELQDIEAAVRWLIKEHPYVDPARIGMSGHSYGGFLTAYALTHSKLFACGIAGAPVTDWRNYDTIYTERYMNTPKENPEGYDKTSVVKAAKNLHGKLLLVHGLMDDNVHVQNVVQLMEELQKADKDFEVMFYPRARHGIFGRHYQRLLLGFMTRHLRPQASRPSP